MRSRDLYRRFLALNIVYRDQKICPTGPIDEFWHAHILDTQAYASDCQHLFGEYLHHFPYFGMRGPADRSDLESAFDQSTALFVRHFGIDPCRGESQARGCSPSAVRRIFASGFLYVGVPLPEDDASLEQANEIFWQSLLDHVRRELPGGPVDGVLDVGCHHGGLLAKLASVLRPTRLIGVEPARTSRERAQFRLRTLAPNVMILPPERWGEIPLSVWTW